MSKLRSKLADTLYPDGLGQDYGRYDPIENNDPARERPMKGDQQTQKDIDQNEEYMFDDRRVKYRVNSDVDNDKPRDQLYDINPNDGIEQPKNNRIRVRLNPQQVLDEHKQRTYRVNVTPPIHTGTDPGNGSYDMPLGNNPREDEVNGYNKGAEHTRDHIDDEHKADTSTPAGRTLPTSLVEELTASFNLGTAVKHAEEGITGKIVFANHHRVTVQWDDHTRERFSHNEALAYLTGLSYVDDAEDVIGPGTEPSIETTDDDGNLTKTNTEVDTILDTALAALNTDDDADIIEDMSPAPPTRSSVDLDKAKLQHQVKQYEFKEISAIKERAARELVDLMKMKGLIADETVEREQIAAIVAMDDTGFELYKSAIIKTQSLKPVTQKSPTQDTVNSEIRSVINSHKGDNTRSLNNTEDKTPSPSDEHVASGNPFANLSGLTAPIQVQDTQQSSRGAFFDQLSQVFTINSPE